MKSWNTCIVPILGLSLQSLVKDNNFNVGQFGELYILIQGGKWGFLLSLTHGELHISIQGGKWQFHPSLGHGEFCGSILTNDPLVHNFGSKSVSCHFIFVCAFDMWMNSTWKARYGPIPKLLQYLLVLIMCRVKEYTPKLVFHNTYLLGDHSFL